MKEKLMRRRFLQWGMAGVGASLVGSKALAADTCDKTAVQPEGPFYPGEGNFVADNDLTRIPGSQKTALGEIVYVKGVVRDLQCRPVEGVNVEIWQAAASGRYNHEVDPNPAPLDPNFRYWGETFTNAKGEYSFKTIKPGAYPAADDWDRPPHIHFRIAKRGYQELITQMYWDGEELNDVDKILQRVPERLRDDVIVKFETNPDDPSTTIGTFNITIEKI